MSLWNRVTSFIKKSDTEYARSSSNNIQQQSVSDYGGSRTTVAKFAMNGGGVGSALPRLVRRQLGYTNTQLNSMTIEDLLDNLMDSHPDVSFAVWNFLRIGNSGYTIKCYKLGSGKPYPQGERDIKELIQRLSLPNQEKFQINRSFVNVLNQLMLSTVTRGAAALELVLLPGAVDVAFLAPVDPALVEFKYEQDRFVPYMNQGKISLDIPTFFYEALDARIDDPYGRSPIVSAINMIMFQMQILNDIKAVVHNQGYPRFDIKVLEEVLLNRMPVAVRHNEVEKAKWLNERLKEIVDMYNGLDPDDAFVHFNSLEVDMVGGKGGAVIDPEKLMNAVDSLIMAGLKTLSTILGRRSTGNTESFAKIETKLYMQGVRAIQQNVEQIINRALTLFLNLRGKQAVVEFQFNALEIRTDLEQEQMRQIKFINQQFARDQGWIDQNEASNNAVGHDPVSETPLVNETPTNKDGDTPRGTPDNNPNSGGNTDIGNAN